MSPVLASEWALKNAQRRLTMENQCSCAVHTAAYEKTFHTYNIYTSVFGKIIVLAIVSLICSIDHI